MQPFMQHLTQPSGGTSSHSHQPRTVTTVVLCVVALHVLAIGALPWSTQATRLDSTKSVAIEMVLAPSPIPSPTSNYAAPTAQAADTAKPKAMVAPTSPSANAAPASAALAPAASTRAASPQTGSPAFTQPSSEAHGLNNPQPTYPRLSRRLNEQGQVVIRVFVTADGTAGQGEIKTSSGYDRLDQEALRTVMRWRFVPGQRLGTPEAMWFNVPVHFVLE